MSLFSPKAAHIWNCILSLTLILGMPVQAYHYDWDQGHDIFDWNDPPPPGPTDKPLCSPCNPNCSSSPVYTSTGHFFWSDTDIILRGRPEIRLTRTYNSHDPRDGLFGNGWSVACEVGLFYNETDDGHQFILRWHDGKRYIYTENQDGSYTPPPSRFEQIVPQTDGTVHLINLDNSRLEFATNGKIAARIDSNGNATRYSYDSSTGLLNKIADDNGRYLQLSYNSRGRVAAVTDHTGRNWNYTYDTNGNLTGVTNPLGGTHQYAYNAYQPNGDGHAYQHLTRVTDASGAVVTNVVYNGERVQSYTEGENRYGYNYNTSSKIVTKRDSTGSSWSYVYNDEGLITKETDPLGFTRSSTYDSNGNLTQLTDELGKVWQSTYDDLGRQLTGTNPLGNTSTKDYTGDNPRPIRLTSPSGRITQLEYDGKLNPIKITDPAGHITQMEWDNRGNLTATIDAQGNRSTLSYTATGLLETVTDPLSRTTRYKYDNVGRLIEIQNAAGEKTQNTYDDLDRLITSTDALGNTVTYTYDAAGRTLSLTDPKSQTTGYSYDSYGRLGEATAPDGRKTQYHYRADNLINRIVRPDATQVTYQYDAAGQLTQENADGDNISYVYDARSDLVQASNATGTVIRSYDDAGRLTTETVNGETISHSYNQEDERIRLSALGSTTDYTRDIRGVINQISAATGIYDFSHDSLGRRTQLNLPNGASTDYGYDAAGQLTQINHNDGINAQYGYSYDAAGRIIRWNGDDADWNYQYDAASRLTKADHGSDNYAYVYDPVGNRQENGGVYDAANRLTEDNSHTYTYDVRGNLTQKQDKVSEARTVYTWNGRNQLVQVQHYPDAVTAEPDKTISYTYGPHGRRWSRTEDGVSEHYVYDGQDRIGTLDASNSLISQVTFGQSIDEPLGADTPSGKRYYQANHQGSVMALVDDLGVAVAENSYSPYGITTTTGEQANPFQYTGRELETDGLYYYRARYYDPTTGLFLSEDPLGMKGGVSTYAYVDGDPINFIDPYGESATAVVSGWIGTDTAILDPTDVAWPKWVGYGVVFGGAVLIDSLILQMAKKSKKTQKERATDIPDWVCRQSPRGPNEKCAGYAARVLAEKYGADDPRAKKRGPGSEYSKIKKNCERGG